MSSLPFPDPPGQPTFSNILPTTLTVAWAPSPEVGGVGPFEYKLFRYTGDSATGTPVEEDIFTSDPGFDFENPHKNETGLIAGATYTYTVVAVNNTGTDPQDSEPSEPATVQTLAGANVRVDGVWKIAIPYVRVSGVWKMAVPWIRVAGVWQQTH